MVKENKETTATRKKPKSWNLISWKFSCSREVCLKKREGGGGEKLLFGILEYFDTLPLRWNWERPITLYRMCL